MSIFKKATTDGEKPEKNVAAPAPAPKADPGKGGKSVDKRNRSLKRISITSTILFLVVVLAFNIVFDSLLGDKATWDWSATQQFTIGDVSQGILNGLDKEVQIIGLFDQDTDTSYTDIRLLLDDYAKKSSGRVTLRYVDPDKYPAIIKEVDPEEYLGLEAGMFVVYCPDTKKAKALSDNDLYQKEVDYQSYSTYITGITAEESFTGAIKYVQSEITPVLYFTTGHGELDYASDYSLLVATMKNNNYDVKDLQTFDLTEIPADCAALIMAQPEKDISADEKAVYEAYLKGGGSLMVVAGYSNAKFPILNQLLASFNLEISNDKVREGDVNYQMNNDAYYMRAIAPTGTLTTELVDGFTLMENVRGMNILSNAKEWITTEAVLTTSPAGVRETGGDVAQSSAAGTQNVAVLSENSGWYDGQTVTEYAKVMLLGSSSMLGDAILQNYGSQIYNFGVFYYGIQWMSNIDAGGDLRIDAKEPVSYALTSGSSGAWNFSAILVFIILPVLTLLAALFVYRRRRHL